MNRESLVKQLKIDREPERRPTRRSWRTWLWAFPIAAATSVVVALAWFLIVRPDITHVDTVEARGVAMGSAQHGAALLDASGYVVALREATVSSKITG
ncbi:MAG TPA: hypothetical protein VG407_05970, partial [Caulobacteraceae bacterium]|nr:hypothetical protein [Caulobacteraceae bacterium]